MVIQTAGAHRSAVDRFLGMEEGRGSNPLESTNDCSINF
jgi:hypothetical protein